MQEKNNRQDKYMQGERLDQRIIYQGERLDQRIDNNVKRQENHLQGSKIRPKKERYLKILCGQHIDKRIDNTMSEL